MFPRTFQNTCNYLVEAADAEPVFRKLEFVLRIAARQIWIAAPDLETSRDC